MSVQNKNRLPYLDYAKGIGIFFVVYAHSIGYLTEATTAESVIWNVIYSFHMPLFFIISGIGLYYKLSKAESVSIGAETRRMAKRLLVPYAFWCVVDVVLWFGASIIKHENLLLSVVKNVYNAFTGRLTPIWFLQTLFIVEVLFIVLWDVINRAAKKYSEFIWCTILLVLYILTMIFDYIYRYVFIGQNSLLLNNVVTLLFRTVPSLAFLCVGYLFGQIVTKCHLLFGNRAKIALLAVSSFAVFLAVELLSGNGVDLYQFILGNVFVFYLVGILGSISFLFISMLLPDGIGFLSAAGKESMHIMVMHHPPVIVLYALIVLCEKYSVPLRPIVNVIISLAAMAAIYYLSKLVIEPITKKLTDMYSRLSEKRSNAIE